MRDAIYKLGLSSTDEAPDFFESPSFKINGNHNLPDERVFVMDTSQLREHRIELVRLGAMVIALVLSWLKVFTTNYFF